MTDAIHFRGKDWRPRLRVTGFMEAERLGRPVKMTEGDAEAFPMRLFSELAWVAWLAMERGTRFEDFMDSLAGLDADDEDRLLGLVLAEWQRFGEAAVENFTAGKAPPTPTPENEA